MFVLTLQLIASCGYSISSATFTKNCLMVFLKPKNFHTTDANPLFCLFFCFVFCYPNVLGTRKASTEFALSNSHFTEARGLERSTDELKSSAAFRRRAPKLEGTSNEPGPRAGGGVTQRRYPERPENPAPESLPARSDFPPSPGLVWLAACWDAAAAHSHEPACFGERLGLIWSWQRGSK